MRNFGSTSDFATFVSRIYLYDYSSAENLKLSEIADYLKEKLGPISVDLRGQLIVASSKRSVESLAKELARAKIRNLAEPHQEFDPLRGEIEFEKKLLNNPRSKLFGILYDGVKLQDIFWEMIPEHERDLSNVHIVFTNRLFGTWDENDCRYHASASIYGFPSIISTTGIVEAPAKPKEFYLEQQLTGLPTEILKEKFRGRFIDHDDERLTEIMKGYVMQAIFYFIASSPFCDDRRCCLFNAHWQEEVLEAQLKQPEFCKRHEKMLEEMRKKFNSGSST
jgi:hypothetical protein